MVRESNDGMEAEEVICVFRAETSPKSVWILDIADLSEETSSVMRLKSVVSVMNSIRFSFCWGFL
jgi:hypothetical protein